MGIVWEAMDFSLGQKWSFSSSIRVSQSLNKMRHFSVLHVLIEQRGGVLPTMYLFGDSHFVRQGFGDADDDEKDVKKSDKRCQQDHEGIRIGSLKVCA